MMKAPLSNLDDRSGEILKIIIRSYVSSGQPVGSRTIAKILDWKLSPATIRNIMADLEDAGFLAQPHTSAGRVPSEHGYRFYVDSLVDAGRMSRSDQIYVNQTLAKGRSPEDLMAKASLLLSNISKNVGIVIAPPIHLTVLKHIEFVDLGDNKILVILVSQTGVVQRKLIRMSEKHSQDELNRAGKYLEEEFSGKNLIQIRAELVQLMKQDRMQYDRMLASLTALWRNTLLETDQDSSDSAVYVQGAANILNQPEFTDIERMRLLFQMFEEKGRLVKILNECIIAAPASGVNIAIGSEVGIPGVHDFSVIAAPYFSGDSAAGFIGIIGPIRMEYDRGIVIVGYVGKVFGEMMSA